MLSWQQAAVLAAGLGAAGQLLTLAAHAADSPGHAPDGADHVPGLARRWAAHVGPFAREAGVVIWRVP
jgi:hypothetical protein